MKALSTLFCLLTITLSVISSAAFADFPFPGRPGRDPGDRWGRGELIFQRVGQQFQGQNILPLRQILNLGPEYRGRRVEKVILRASTAFGFGQATVLVNGAPVTYSQQVGTYMGDYIFMLPPHADEFGAEIQSLQIELRGNFFVDGVGVRVSRGGAGPGFPTQEVIQINQQFVGASRLALANYVNLDRFNGMRLNRVIIRAVTRAGRGDATLCTLGCQTINDIATVIQDYSFDGMGAIVDFNARNWFLDLRGNFYIENIRLEFSRF